MVGGQPPRGAESPLRWPAVLVGTAFVFAGTVMINLAPYRWAIFVPPEGNCRLSLPFVSYAFFAAPLWLLLALWCCISRSVPPAFRSAKGLALGVVAGVFSVFPDIVDTRTGHNASYILMVFSRSLLPAAIALFFKLFSRDQRPYCNVLLVLGLAGATAAPIVQHLDPDITSGIKTFTALNAGWSAIYLISVLGYGLYFALSGTFVQRHDHYEPITSEADLLLDGERASLLYQYAVDKRPLAQRCSWLTSLLSFLALSTLVATAMIALGPLYDAIPRVGIPAGFTFADGSLQYQDESIDVHLAYTRFFKGFSYCMHSENYHSLLCDEQRKLFQMYGGGNSLAIAGIALCGLYSPLISIIPAVAGTIIAQIVRDKLPDWNRVEPVHLNSAQYGEAAAALVLSAVSFALVLGWEVRSKRKAAHLVAPESYRPFPAACVGGINSPMKL